ncbi:TPA: ABC transporter permease, partial [Clostridioides difficile]|nr:ABC transporter permease [Clostridioides difficile]
MKELLDIISCEFSKLKRLKFILISILGACLFPIPA